MSYHIELTGSVTAGALVWLNTLDIVATKAVSAAALAALAVDTALVSAVAIADDIVVL